MSRKLKTSTPQTDPASTSPLPPLQGQRVGYVRVSSIEQNTARQLDGERLHRTFTDQVSGKNTDRPQLDALLAHVREGDEVVVHSFDRLARDLDDLRRLVTDLTARGVQVHFLKERLIFTGEDSPMSNLLLNIMGAFAEFERAMIRERQREGIEVAKRKGVYKGRKKALTPAQAAEVQRRVQAGESKAAVARDVGVSRETLYRYLTPSPSA